MSSNPAIFIESVPVSAVYFGLLTRLSAINAGLVRAGYEQMQCNFDFDLSEINSLDEVAVIHENLAKIESELFAQIGPGFILSR